MPAGRTPLKIMTVDDWTVGRCSQCSLVYINPIPFFEKSNYHDIAKVYYYTKFQREITPDKVEFKKRQLRSQADEISGFAPFSSGLVKFLDIGCGPGLGVRAAADLGWEAVGIDIDSELVCLGQEKLGVDVRCSDLIESRFLAGQFNFIQFMTVLQLLPNPLDALVEAKRLLAPGGVVLIVLPNQDGLLNQINLLIGRKHQKRFGTLILPYHLHAFTPKTLTRLIERSGPKLHSIKTAMPVDPRYASIDQVQNGGVRQTPVKLVWRFAEFIGRGSVLVAYAGKPK
jgi:SAM-dependent methyltransferase